MELRNEYGHIMSCAYSRYYMTTSNSLEEFLIHFDKSKLYRDMLTQSLKVVDAYTPLEYLFQIFENNEEEAQPIIECITEASKTQELSHESVVITRAVMSTLVELFLKYEVTCTQVLKYVDFDHFDFYDWKYIESIPRIREDLIKNFELNFKIRNRTNSKPILIENRGV